MSPPSRRGRKPPSMAKSGGKLGKLRSVLKRINSLANPRHCIPTPSSAAVSADDDDDLLTVYIGSSRKRYLLSPSVVDHPLFRELVERTGEHSRDDDDGVSINVGCEVVLFEHLLWMLEDERDRHDQPESVKELVGYYACS